MNPNKLNTSLEFIKGIGKIRSKLIRDELKNLYPEINFIVYDTSDPKDTKKKRIIIKK